MTSQEAKQQVDACERQIMLAYNDMKSAARDVGSASYSAASREKARIENDANGTTSMNTMLSLLISLVGIILFLVSDPVWGILLFIVGIVVAYNVYQSADAKASKRIGEATKILNNVNSQQVYLNSVLDKNETM